MYLIISNFMFRQYFGVDISPFSSHKNFKFLLDLKNLLLISMTGKDIHSPPKIGPSIAHLHSNINSSKEFEGPGSLKTIIPKDFLLKFKDFKQFVNCLLKPFTSQQVSADLPPCFDDSFIIRGIQLLVECFYFLYAGKCVLDVAQMLVVRGQSCVQLGYQLWLRVVLLHQNVYHLINIYLSRFSGALLIMDSFAAEPGSLIFRPMRTRITILPFSSFLLSLLLTILQLELFSTRLSSSNIVIIV